MDLKSMQAALPPGNRFHPRDEELVCYYLYKKIANDGSPPPPFGNLVEVNLHTCEPWMLPVEAQLGVNEWYFFAYQDRKYAKGLRTNRATNRGYWKATGKDRTVTDPASNLIVGMRKTLVFYIGRAPRGVKTSWVMHEFRMETPNSPRKEDWVLCRVFVQNRGEQIPTPNINNEHDDMTMAMNPFLTVTLGMDETHIRMIDHANPSSEGHACPLSHINDLSHRGSNSNAIALPGFEEEQKQCEALFSFPFSVAKNEDKFDSFESGDFGEI